jgi:hypothetical protein
MNSIIVRVFRKLRLRRGKALSFLPLQDDRGIHDMGINLRDYVGGRTLELCRQSLR